MKPENRFIYGVHKYLDPEEVTFEKMHNPYRAGIPDVYYEGPARAFWVEYKFLPWTPAKQFRISLSALQRRWLRRNYDNGHRPFVIVGHPVGGYILDTPRVWEMKDISPRGLTSLSRQEIAAFIKEEATSGKDTCGYSGHL